MTTSSRLHVWFVTHYGALEYGANLSLLNLLQGLDRSEIEPLVLIPQNGTFCETLDTLRIPYAVRSFACWSSRGGSIAGLARRALRNVVAARRIQKQLRDLPCDAVYTNSSVIPLGWILSRRLQRPHVWHLREFGDLDHGATPDFGNAFHRRCFASADATICVSRAVRDYHVLPHARNRSHVIYNGVATESVFGDLRQRRKARVVRADAPFTFALVGVLAPTKGQDIAISALAEVVRSGRRARLLIVGNGEHAFSSKCKALALEHNIAENVEFWGYEPDPFGALMLSDAALMCSRAEAMGRVTAEAMAAGIPVIGVASGGTVELIEHDRDGLHFDGSVAGLAAAMLRFVDSPNLARDFGEAAWASAKSRFTIEKYAGAVASVIRGVVTAAPHTSH